MTFVQHSLKEFIRDERAWQRALDQPTDLNNAALTTNAHDTCWYLFHRGTTENARSLRFAERLRSSSLPRSCSRESSVRSSTASLQQKQVKKQSRQRSVANEEDETVTVINMDESDENIARQQEEFWHNKNKTSQNLTTNRFAEHLRWNKSMRLTDNERANMDILQRLFARNLQKHFIQQRTKLVKLKDKSDEIKRANDNANKKQSVKDKGNSNENERINNTCTKSNNRHVTEELMCTRKHKNVYQQEKEQLHEEKKEQEVQEQSSLHEHHTWVSKVVNVAKARGQSEENAESRQVTLSNMAIVKGYFGYYLHQLCQLESVQRSNVIFHERQQHHKFYKQFYETLCLLLTEDEYNTRHKLFSVYVQEHLMLMDVERESFAQISGTPFDLFVAIANVERSEDEHRISIISSEEQEMKKYAQLSYLYELNYVNEHLKKCTQRERKLKRNAQYIGQ